MLETKIIVFYFTEYLVQKAKFLKKNLSDWHDESLQCCCHTIISRSRLKLSYSLVIFTWLCSPWDPYKLCWKKKLIFPKDLLLFYMFNFWWVQYWIEDQLTDVSTWFYTSVSWRWRVDPSASWPVGDLTGYQMSFI